MIYLFYTSFYQRLPAVQFESMMQQVPLVVQEKLLRFKKWQDAQRGLLGSLLLSKGLQVIGADDYSLRDIKYTNYKKPYFDEILRFNISHSGAYVVCVLSKTNKLGVDIELIKQIDLQDVQSQFAPREWMDIQQAQNPLHAFYTYWTQKEAFLKAIGLGLSFSPDKINFTNNTIVWKGDLWYSKEILLDQEYACHIVTDAPDSRIVIEKIDF